MKEVMQRAHEIAKSIQVGTYKMKIAAGLRQAWKEWRMNKMIENLKNMSTEELKALKTQIEAELETRKPKEIKHVAYAHCCMNCSKHHLTKYKHWAKLVTGIDTSKANGYAFQGEFLSVKSESMVPVGSIIVEVCDNVLFAHQMTENGKELIERVKTNAMSELIGKLAGMVA